MCQIINNNFLIVININNPTYYYHVKSDILDDNEIK